jgi:hypothetical protein
LPKPSTQDSISQQGQQYGWTTEKPPRNIALGARQITWVTNSRGIDIVQLGQWPQEALEKPKPGRNYLLWVRRARTLRVRMYYEFKRRKIAKLAWEKKSDQTFNPFTFARRQTSLRKRTESNKKTMNQGNE